ncbi:MAG: hypothetical protein ACI4E1_05970 [Lachnospira sp.]
MTFKKMLLCVSMLCACAFILTGCNMPNPIKYMREADERYLDALQQDNDNDDNHNDDSESVSKKGVAIIDALNMRDTKDMVTLSSEVKKQLEEKETTGVVVLVDNSVINDFSFFIHITNEITKPVIAISDESYSDDACEITTCSEAKGKGVLIYDGGNVLAAEGDAAFGVSVNSSGAVVFAEGFKDYKPGCKTVFDISDVSDLPYVPVIYDYSGNDGTFVEKMLNLSEGLIIVTDSYDGNLSETIYEIAKSCAKSQPVVRLATSASDKVTTDRDAGFIEAGNLLPSKARILLAAGITMTSDSETLQSIFNEYK